MSTMLSLRKTGRTTRMLQRATELANQGRTVYVVCATNDHVNIIRRECGDARLKFVSSESSLFDWGMMSIRGISRDAEVLIDHYCFERRFSNVLRRLHEFDEPKELPAWMTRRMTPSVSR